MSDVTSTAAQDTTIPAPQFLYSAESTVFMQLISDYAKEQEAVDRRRQLRYPKTDVRALRASGEIAEDETFIDDRTIDFSIRTERPAYIRYIASSQTVLSFTNVRKRAQNYEALDNFTTHLFRAGSWKIPLFRHVDGRALHGGAALELIFDESARGKAVIENIKREDLIIPMDTTDLSACARFARRYVLTKLAFRKLAQRQGFDTFLVDKVIKAYEGSTEAIKIYKWFMRADDGTLYVAWTADAQAGLSDYLFPPVEFKSGILEVDPETREVTHRKLDRPRVYFSPYDVHEDEKLMSIPGRAQLDAPVQEALSAMVTATVNGSVRAAGIYPYEKKVPGIETPKRNKENRRLKHMEMADGDLGFLQVPWPSPQLLQVAQFMQRNSLQQLGKADFAALTRHDTEKTVGELEMASNEADLLSSTSMEMFSDGFLQLYLDWWEIIRSHINAGQITPPDSFEQSGIDINDPDLVATLAADAQVVKRAEKIQQYLKYYSLAVGTPMQEPMFLTIMSKLFPEDIALWKQEAMKNDVKTQTLQQTKQSLEALPEELIMALPPQIKEALTQIINNIDQLFAPQNQAQ